MNVRQVILSEGHDYTSYGGRAVVAEFVDGRDEPYEHVDLSHEELSDIDRIVGLIFSGTRANLRLLEDEPGEQGHLVTADLVFRTQELQRAVGRMRPIERTE